MASQESEKAVVSPHGQHQDPAEGLTDVPAAFAPRTGEAERTAAASASAVPPIDGFRVAVGDRALPTDTSPLPQPHQLSSSQAGSTNTRPAIRSVPPRGVFSLRNSSAVLSKAPFTRQGGPEVEPAGWDAASYPFESELDEVIRQLSQEINEEPMAVVHSVSGSPSKIAVHDISAARAMVTAATQTTTAVTTEARSATDSAEYDAEVEAAPPGEPATPNSDQCTEKPQDTWASADAPFHPLEDPSEHQDMDGDESELGDVKNEEMEVDEDVDEDEEDIIRVYSTAADTWKAVSPPRALAATSNDEGVDAAKTVPTTAGHEVRELRQSTPDKNGLTPLVGVRVAPNRHLQRVGAAALSASSADPSQLRVASSTQTSRQSSKLRRGKSVDPSQGEALVKDEHQEADCSRRDSYAGPTESWERRVWRPSATGKGDGASAGDADGAFNTSSTPDSPEVSPQNGRSQLGSAEGNTRNEGQPCQTRHVAPAGPFRLETAARSGASKARRQRREERERKAREAEEATKVERERRLLARAVAATVSPTGEVAKPKGFDAIADEGRRKRQALEKEERQRKLREEQQLTFKPKISPAVERQRRRSSQAAACSSSTGGAAATTAKAGTADVESFLAKSKEWEERREHRLEAIQRRLRDEEEAERRRRFVNEETERIMQRRLVEKDTPSGGAAVTVFDRLAMEAAAREEARRKLEERYTPSFKPETNHEHRSSRSNSAGPTTITAAGCSEESPATEGVRTIAKEPDYFEALYQRSLERKKHAEQDRARKREAEAAPRGSQGSAKRTQEEIAAHVALMATREAEWRTKFEQKIEREREAKAAAAAASVGFAAAANPREAQLAQRGRQRMEMREEQKRRAAEEEKRRKEQEVEQMSARRRATTGFGSGGKKSKSADRATPPRLPPTLEAHEQQTAERRAKEVERLRQQLLEKEMAECTFKPAVCPASEEIASRVRFTQVSDSLSPSPYRGRGALPCASPAPARGSSIQGTLEAANGDALSGASGRLWCDSGASPFASEERREQLQEIPAGGAAAIPASATGTGMSPPPRQPSGRSNASSAFGHSGSENRAPPRNTDSLAKEVESLERVLNQWKQLEEEVSA